MQIAKSKYCFVKIISIGRKKKRKSLITFILKTDSVYLVMLMSSWIALPEKEKMFINTWSSYQY